MKTFTEWLEATNEGMFDALKRSLMGGNEQTPKMSPDQQDAYDQLRATGVSHGSALRTVMGQPVFQRNVSRAAAHTRSDVEGRWGSR